MGRHWTDQNYLAIQMHVSQDQYRVGFVVNTKIEKYILGFQRINDRICVIRNGHLKKTKKNVSTEDSNAE